MIVVKMGIGSSSVVGRGNLLALNKAPIGAMLITHSTGEIFIKRISGLWDSSSGRLVSDTRLASESASLSSTITYPESRRL